MSNWGVTSRIKGYQNMRSKIRQEIQIWMEPDTSDFDLFILISNNLVIYVYKQILLFCIDLKLSLFEEN